MELGVAWLAAAGTLEAVAFVTDVTDRIEYDLEGMGYRQESAVGRSQGLEFSIHRDLWRYITLSAQYTFNQTFVDKDAAADQQRPQRPRDSYALGFNSRWLEDRLSLNALYRGSYRTMDTQGQALNNYQVLDFNASWQMHESLQYYVRVRNALDAEYQEIRHYRSAPRTYYAGVKLAF